MYPSGRTRTAPAVSSGVGSARMTTGLLTATFGNPQRFTPAERARLAAAGEASAHAERGLATLITTALRDQARGGDRLTLFAEDPVTRR
jgi:hypothetical protein